jgi:streptomycin 6-kinase
MRERQKIERPRRTGTVVSELFNEYLGRWRLVPDGNPIITRGSRLLPVRMRGTKAMLKVAMDAEEKFGESLLRWWDGQGAAKVLEHADGALLMERAEGPASLAEMASSERDDEASRIICQVIAQLHAPTPAHAMRPVPDLVPLSLWFRELEPTAEKHGGMKGGILPACAAISRELLASERDVVVLHGDIHHGNILDFGARGWLAIDPKGLVGERGFDYANLFCNPEAAIAMAPGRLVRQVDVVVEAAGLERQRLLKWIMAYAGLSAAWFIGDEEWEPAKVALAVVELAAGELDRTAS